MQTLLPQIIHTSYEEQDEEFYSKLRIVVQNFDVEGCYLQCHKDTLSGIIASYAKFVENFVFEHKLYGQFNVFVERIPELDVKKNFHALIDYIESLAITQGCNYIDKHISAYPCINNDTRGKIGFAHVAGGYHKDSNGYVSNWMFFIILEMQ